MRIVPLALALLMLATTLPMPDASAGTYRALEIWTDTAHPKEPFRNFDTTPKVFDFNGDGKMEIVVQNDNRYTYVFDPKSGDLLAELTTTYPAHWGARPLNSVEAAIIHHGSAPHVVIANSAAVITVYRYDGHSDGRHHFTKQWDRRLNDCFGGAGMDAKPVLHDLDGDGDLEILAQTEEEGVFALRMDGSTYWKRCIGGGNGEPAVADMDFDGVPEVVWASDGGVVTRMDGRTGNTDWTFWVGDGRYNIGPGAMPVGPTIGQVDGHGQLDVVVGVRDSHDKEDQSNNHAALFAIKGEWGLLWMRQDKHDRTPGAPLTYTHPIIYDIDHDGQSDIFWADWNTIGHKPPYDWQDQDPWQRTGPAHFYRYDAAGNKRWETQLDTYWQNKDLALADVDDDGVQEVLANGPGCGGGDAVWYLDGKTGHKEACISVHPWKVSRGPVVADLWGWGTMQWVVPVAAATDAVRGGGILVYDTGVPYDSAWPHLPYPHHGSGSGGGGGGGGGSGGGGNGGGSSFTVSFDVPDPTNNWWVESYVQASRSLSKVEAIVDGDPTVLEKKSWGSWAKSFHVPDGSRVTLRAWDGNGNNVRSDEYIWGEGSTGSGGGSSGFDPKFTVPSGVNEWWVEVKVQSDRSLSKVTASVDGGSPVRLDHTSWGTWAKSFHVSKGSSVVFTATASDGASAKSQTYAWLGSSGAGFAPTFKVPYTDNNWWAEVYVDADRELSSVRVQLDGGGWTSLEKKSWGSWAKSIHVPDGSKVRFQAVASDGAAAESSTYTWT